MLKLDFNRSIDFERGLDSWNGLKRFDASYNNPVVKLAIGRRKEFKFAKRVYPIFLSGLSEYPDVLSDSEKEGYDWKVKKFPVDIVRQIKIYFHKKSGLFYGFKMVDEQGKIFIKAVKEKYKKYTNRSSYSFSIGQGERIVGMRGRYNQKLQFVIGRVANQ